MVTAVAQAIWCGLCGIACGWFFALQGRWFGCGHDLATVLPKVIVDQFIWSVLVIVPGTAVFYAVLSGGWRVKDERVPFGTFGLLSAAGAVICVGLGEHSGRAIRASSSLSADGR